jgi:hypothetical protein
MQSGANFHDCMLEEFEDAKGVIRICISKKNRQKKKDKQRSTKHTYKAKDQVTRTPLKTGVGGGAWVVRAFNIFLSCLLNVIFFFINHSSDT